MKKIRLPMIMVRGQLANPSLKYFQYGGYSTPYHLYNRADISSDPERRKPGQWQKITEHGRRRVYLTCPQCVSILEVTDHFIYNAVDGQVDSNECIVCHECAIHFWVRLNGWNYSRKKTNGS